MRRLIRMTAVLEPLVDGQAALARATDIARQSGARLELLCVDFNPALTGQPHVDATILKEVRDAHTKDVLHWMDGVRRGLLVQGLDATTTVTYGRPYYEHVLSHMQAHAPDLLIKGARFHSLFERNYFTASDWHLIARSPVPLLLVKRRTILPSAPVIAAVDPFHDDDAPSELDLQVLETAAVMARMLNRELRVVHAVSPLSAYPRADVIPFGRTRAEAERTERHARAVLELARPFCATAASVTVECGRPEDIIVRAALQQDAAMVVMGAVSRASMREYFIGNTAERVLEEISNDVLVVPVKPRARA
jgi:universal stress protein E